MDIYSPKKFLVFQNFLCQSTFHSIAKITCYKKYLRIHLVLMKQVSIFFLDVNAQKSEM